MLNTTYTFNKKKTNKTQNVYKNRNISIYLNTYLNNFGNTLVSNQQLLEFQFPISLNVVHVITHANFPLYRAYPARVIWKKLTTDDKYVNKRVQLFIHQTRCLSNMTYQEKNISCVMYF